MFNKSHSSVQTRLEFQLNSNHLGEIWMAPVWHSDTVDVEGGRRRARKLCPPPPSVKLWISSSWKDAPGEALCWSRLGYCPDTVNSITGELSLTGRAHWLLTGFEWCQWGRGREHEAVRVKIHESQCSDIWKMSQASAMFLYWKRAVVNMVSRELLE